MDKLRHRLSMMSVLVLLFILAIGPLAVLYGRDSLPYEERPRGWWAGAPRR